MYSFLKDLIRDKSIILEKNSIDFIRGLIHDVEPDYIDIRPCPFCWSMEAKFIHDDEVAWIECPDCHGRSGVYSSEEAAVIGWNFRTNLPQQIERLKPCPICGSPASLAEVEEGCFVVECQVCGTDTDFAYNEAEKEEIIRKWNTRTYESSTVSREEFEANLRNREDY